MKLCFSTLGCTERSLDEILSLSRKFDISFLEIRGIGGELDNRKIPDFSCDALAGTKEKFRENGISPLILGTSCSFHDEAGFESAVEEGKAAILTCAALGAKGIRVFGNNLGNDPAASTGRVIAGLKTLCTFAAESGTDVLLEVHGDFNTVEALAPVLDAMESEERFGLIWDICHTQKTYGGRWRDFYGAVRPFIRHVHIKDIKNDRLVLPGDGDIPIKDIVSGMINDGYSGAFSLEWEKKWHPELPEIEEALTKFIEVTAQQ